MTTTIRQMTAEEYPLLEEFCYQAIFLPKGVPAPDRSIIQLPKLQLYVKDFGRYPHDQAMVADVDGQVVGAVWVRIIDDYGHIDDETLSLSMSLLPAYRGQGIGTELLKAFLKFLKVKGYHKVSLSVQKENYACNMYRKAGFQTIIENETDFIMVCELSKAIENETNKIKRSSINRK
ncbi:GNAT family N-acetyltransferase [Streptococcus macacae]|uniref:FR47-like protein n=1 Tax=Streptococcus macacae NCTC 11558 TaxID=764298 RepID=G5JUU5_9STRE|nr:GNAT family N-acetyltransferase [Streptococcus macacae]EHJ52408.1 FR47-like protein [Streptococcus macacae NCTC 11558]SUN78910.1 putative acetyltransferase [Streptococcus macacae NCTC 11558]